MDSSRKLLMKEQLGLLQVTALPPLRPSLLLNGSLTTHQLQENLDQSAHKRLNVPVRVIAAVPPLQRMLPQEL